ncbi:MAG TPA: DNA polymerase I [Acidimicrobiia bacterium]
MPTLAVLDGNSIAYRAFFALPPDLQTTGGQITNAVFGFTRMLIKLLGDHHPDGVAVAWDVSRQTFRSERYTEYKAQREGAPEGFRSQMPLIDEVLQVLGIPQLRLEGYEADDLIASLSELARKQAWDVLVVTGDRDAFQLVDDHLRVLYTRRGISDVVVADATYVEDRYQIRPDQYVDYAALRGDTSDNLPGVPRVGEKTAARLVGDFGTLEGIYSHLDELTPKLRSSLAEGREQVFLNRELMTLVSNLGLGVEIDDLVRQEWEREPAKRLFDSLEFHSLWEDLLAAHPSAGTTAGEVVEVETRLTTDAGEVGALARRSPLVMEAVRNGDLWGLAIAGDGIAAAVPLDALEPLREAMADPDRPKRAHDAKPLIEALAAHDILLDGLEFDTALAAYVLDPSTRSYDLVDLAARLLGLEVESVDAVDEGSQGTLAFEGRLDLEKAGRRVEVIGLLADRLQAELAERGEADLYATIELPLVPVLARMERTGLGVDREYLEELGETLREELSVLERKIHELAGGPFNINSTGQLRDVLYNRLGLPVKKKTSTGAPSTDASVLEKLAEEHTIIEPLLRFRELEKLRSTYVDAYLPLITREGRLHTSFNQMAATTGRLSSETPNLQNIPIRSETGRTIRKAFVPRPGWTFVVADYSQIELRVLAHMSEDPVLVDAFLADADVHTETAARVFGLEPEAVSADLRRVAKTINFGLLYGMEAFGLADRLGISRDEARGHIEAYFAQFPSVSEYMDGVVVLARNQGFTTTLFGRRRYLPELKSDNYRVRQMGERMALNAPIQGSAADIIKKAMIDLDRSLSEREMETALLLQIHDELVLESPPAELEAAIDLAREVMEGVVELAVPLRVDISTGGNLAEVKS